MKTIRFEYRERGSVKFVTAQILAWICGSCMC